MNPEAIQSVVRKAQTSEEFLNELKTDPVTILKEEAERLSPLQTDRWVYRLSVGGLSLVVLITVIGGIVLGLDGKEVPDMLTAVGSAAVGALAGLLIIPGDNGNG